MVYLCVCFCIHSQLGEKPNDILMSMYCTHSQLGEKPNGVQMSSVVGIRDWGRNRMVNMCVNVLSKKFIVCARGFITSVIFYYH